MLHGYSRVHNTIQIQIISISCFQTSPKNTCICEDLESLQQTLFNDILFSALYNDLGQALSVGNYWNGIHVYTVHDSISCKMFCIHTDPYHQDLYNHHCNYLPLLNNGTNPCKMRANNNNLLIHCTYHLFCFFVQHTNPTSSSFSKW